LGNVDRAATGIGPNIFGGALHVIDKTRAIRSADREEAGVFTGVGNTEDQPQY
jgi:hypothetical protein